MADKDRLLVRVDTLKDFCTQVFQKTGVPEEDARITADVLVAAAPVGDGEDQHLPGSHERIDIISRKARRVR